MATPWRLVCLLLLLLPLACRSQQASNGTGLLSDIWNSLTTVGKVDSCPGECIHAITSIFCGHVIEEISCGEPYLRCCINQKGNTTFVEGTTLPPPTAQPETITPSQTFIVGNDHRQPDNEPIITTESSPVGGITWITTPAESAPITVTDKATVDQHVIATNNNNNDNEFGNNNRTTDDSTSLSPCPIRCTKPTFNSYCVKPIFNAYCDRSDEECCLESKSPAEPSAMDALDAMTKNLIKLVQQSVANNESKNIGTELSGVSLTSSTTTAATPTTTLVGGGPTTTTQTPPTLRACEGTCVIPLFSVLCDDVDKKQFCANGGSCCVNRELITTTTPPAISNCEGTCLPAVLSGMCNKPYELILKTLDCSSGTICCAFDKKYENEDPAPAEEEVKQPEESTPNLYTPERPSLMIPPRLPVPSSGPNYPNNNNNKYMPPNNALPMPSLHPTIIGNRNKVPPIDGHGHMISNSHNFPQQPSRPPPEQMFIPPKTPIESTASTNNKPFFWSSRPEAPEAMNDTRKPIDDNNNNKFVLNSELFPCPGSCLNSMLKFTCFGTHNIHTRFHCTKGHVCCAPLGEIEKLEAFIQTATAAAVAAAAAAAAAPPSLPSAPAIVPPPVPIMVTTEKPILEPKAPSVCGVKGSSRTGRVVGGSDAYENEWCWQIALVNKDNKYICGGSLIGRQWAVTAAHCVHNFIRSNEPIFIRAGDYDLTRTSRFGQMQKVSTSYIHHNHNSQNLDNDIALLKLQAPMGLNDHTCLVCLPTQTAKRDPGKRCIVTGYGSQHETGPYALRVRKASVPIVEDRECSTQINAFIAKLFILPANSFCAGGDGVNDACIGDGGSGLVCESDGFYELTGLVSTGFGCARKNVPGVYVKVSSFVGWINQIVSTNNN